MTEGWLCLLTLGHVGFPLRICVLLSLDFYEKCHTVVSAYGKHMVELLSGSQNLKKSTFLPNLDKIKNFSHNLSMCMSVLYKKKTSPLVIKKHKHHFFSLKFHMTLILQL